MNLDGFVSEVVFLTHQVDQSGIERNLKIAIEDRPVYAIPNLYRTEEQKDRKSMMRIIGRLGGEK